MHQATTPSPAQPSPARRSDAGTVRVSDRDIAGLMLCGEMYGAPYDLLAAYLDVRPDRLRGIAARWRAAGYAETGRLGPGPAWCWLTRTGLAVTGLRFAADAAVAGPAGAPARRAGRPPGAGIQPRRAGRAAVVALRAAYPRRDRRPGRDRAHPRRRSVLARDSRQPLPGRTVGHRGRADPQAAGPHRHHHGRAAGPPHRLQPRRETATTGPATTGPST